MHDGPPAARPRTSRHHRLRHQPQRVLRGAEARRQLERGGINHDGQASVQPLPVGQPVAEAEQLLLVDLLEAERVTVRVAVAVGSLQELFLELDQARVDLDPATRIGGLGPV